MYLRRVGGVERFRFYVPGTDKHGRPKQCLPIHEPIYRPFPCASLEDFIHCPEPHLVPLAFLQCKKELCQLDPEFLVPQTTYFAVAPNQLFPYWHNLPPERQTVAGFAYFDFPVHVFNDLDWDEIEYGKLPFNYRDASVLARLQLAFVTCFSAVFQDEFKREPNWKDTHWESG